MLLLGADWWQMIVLNHLKNKISHLTELCQAFLEALYVLLGDDNEPFLTITTTVMGNSQICWVTYLPPCQQFTLLNPHEASVQRKVVWVRKWWSTFSSCQRWIILFLEWHFNKCLITTIMGNLQTCWASSLTSSVFIFPLKQFILIFAVSSSSSSSLARLSLVFLRPVRLLK